MDYKEMPFLIKNVSSSTSQKNYLTMKFRLCISYLAHMSYINEFCWGFKT